MFHKNYYLIQNEMIRKRILLEEIITFLGDKVIDIEGPVQDVFIDNLANEPAGIALKNDLKRYLIRLSFFGSDIAEDGSEFFTFHVVGNEDSWYIFSGLYWDDPLVDEGPDV